MTTARRKKVECIFKCSNPRKLFRFPSDEKARRTWLDILEMDTLPRTIHYSRICANHFSDRMFLGLNKGHGMGTRLSQCAIPDRNIPGKSLPDPSISVVRPRPDSTLFNLAQIPRIVGKSEIITSRESKCLLKCKGATTVFRFPNDKEARDFWAKRLGFEKTPRRSSQARICSNHFSPTMFTKSKSNRLTETAIPDMNLPGGTIFIPETEVPGYVEHAGAEPSMSVNFLPNEQEISDLLQSVLDAPIILDDSAPKTNSEILINPLENIKSVVNLPSNKEGILHVFQPGVSQNTDVIEEPTEDHIAVPDNVGDMECVLKCPQVENLYSFPKNETSRQLWLSKIGLTHCYFNTKICDRHFSDQMFNYSKTRLTKHAYPDKNIPENIRPRIKDASKILTEYRLLAKDKHLCNVIELPQNICVLTVFKAHNEIGAAVNGVKYVQHKIDDTIPKREREVQVDMADLIRTTNVGISPDDYEMDDDFEFEINTAESGGQNDWMNIFKSHVFSSKADMHECLVCGEISVGDDCNIKHSHVHKETTSLCFHCGRVFSTRLKLKIHEKNKHVSRRLKALRCPKMHCNKVFHSTKKLHYHVDEHTRNTRPMDYKCVKCQRKFASFLKMHCHRVVCKNLCSSKYSKMPLKGISAKMK